MHQLTNLQADYIEMTLAAHKIAGRVVGGLVLPRIIRHQLALALDEKPERVISLQRALAHRLGAAVRVFASASGELSVEVERPDRDPVLLRNLVKSGRDLAPPNTAVLGLAMDDGAVLQLHLPSHDVAHVLISGTTGSGKTALSRAMIASLAMYNRPDRLQLVLIDPKGREFADLAWLPHLMLGQVTVDVDDSVDVVAMLVQTMLDRDRAGLSEPRLIVVIDELADLIMAGGAPVEKKLQRLVQRGRGAGIHLIACTQRPSTDAVGGLIRSNFPVRIVGSVTRPEDAKLASGLAGTGAEGLLGGGDFLIIQHSDITRFQAAFVDQDLVHLLRWRAHRTRRPSGPDPLAAYRQAVKESLHIIADNRPDRVEADARKVLAAPGWPDEWIHAGEFAQDNWQGEIGRLIGRQNAGAGHYHIVDVGDWLLNSSRKDLQWAESS